MKFVGKSVPKDTLFNWTTEAKYGFPSLHKDVGLGGSLAITCGSDKKLIGNTTLIARLLNDYQFGVNYTRNLKENLSTGLEFAAVARISNDIFAFTTFNQTKKLLEIGGTQKLPENFIADKAALLASINLNKDKDGKIGKVFSLVTEKKIDEWSSVRTRADFDQSVLLTAAFTTKLSQNLKLRVADAIDPLAAYKNRNLKSYKIGFSLDFEF